MGYFDTIQISKILLSCSTVSDHLYLIYMICNGNIYCGYGVDESKIFTDIIGDHYMCYMETGTQ